MRRGTGSRISVLRNNVAVSLYPAKDRDVISSPWPRLLSEKHHLGTLEVPEHEHESFCLHLQLSGSPELEWWCDGKNAVERPLTGALILLPPGTRDRLRWKGGTERFVVSLDAGFVRDFANELKYGLQPSFQAQWNFHDEALRALLGEIGREATEGWPLGTLYGDLLGLSLTTLLLQRHANEKIKLPQLRGGLSPKTLKSSLEFITDNLHRDLPLREIAASAGMSPFHFARLFRNATGQTPHQYLLDQRFNRAKWLLRFSHLSVSQVGSEVGFTNHTHFTRTFRRKEGITPTIWRGAQ
ncbi:helix-turn-helix domain-containing protein [Silvibacterium sp.]|uniref:helix-turn-helix domain-containing protein n=1 Tax=Silvibacterium sp. TaxID=1964179 RepID=UPI0039E28B20